MQVVLELLEEIETLRFLLRIRPYLTSLLPLKIPGTKYEYHMRQTKYVSFYYIALALSQILGVQGYYAIKSDSTITSTPLPSPPHLQLLYFSA